MIPPEGGQRDSKGRNSQTLEGIFGDAADLSSSDDEGETATPPRRIVREEVDFGDMSDDCGAEGVADVEARIEEEAPVEEEAPRINVDIPRCVAELGTDIHFVKLPNFLSVEPRFGPTYVCCSMVVQWCHVTITEWLSKVLIAHLILVQTSRYEVA